MTQPPGWSSPEEPVSGPVPPPFQPPSPAAPSAPSAPPPGGWGAAPPPPAYGAPPQWATPGSPPPGHPNYPAYPGMTPVAWAAPRPGIVPLRPLSLGEIFDGAFQAIRTNPRTMIGVSAVVLAVITLVSTLPQASVIAGLGDSPLLADSGTDPSTEELVSFLGMVGTAALLPALLQILAVIILQAILVVAVSGAVLGNRIPPGELWRRTRGRVLAVLGLTILTGLLTLVAASVVWVPGVLLLVADQPLLGGLALFVGFVASVVVYALLTVRWSLSGPALLLEGQRVTGAMRRSWKLTGGSFWRVLGILLLSGILVSIGSQLISLPFSIAGSVIGTVIGPETSFTAVAVSLLIGGIGTVLAGAVFYPFSAAVTGLLYIDLRMRREGLDVQLLQATGTGGTGR